MMNRKLWNSALIGVFFLTLFSCSSPEPVPDLTFKSLLELNENNELTAIPMPFVDFTKGAAEAKAWEKNYSSELKEEKADKLLFDTKDPKANNPQRAYYFSAAKMLIRSEVIVAETILLDGGEVKASLVALFKQSGFAQENNAFINKEKGISIAVTKIAKGLAALNYTPINNVQPQPSSFKPLLKLDADGHLAELPIPFSDFTKGKAEAKAWEAEYGSTLIAEDANNGLNLIYQTNDPKRQNTMRIYLFDAKGRLSNSSLSVAFELIFNGAGTELTDELQLLLHQGGYRPLEGKANIYNNGTYLLSIERGAKSAQLYYTPSSQPALVDFEANAKDFPLLLPNKYPKDLTFEEIKAYEAKLGLRTDIKESGRVISFMTTSENASKLNLHVVEYDCRDMYNGKPDNGAIMATSLSIANVDMLAQSKVANYIKEQGFVFQKIQEVQSIKVHSYFNEKLGYYLHIANSTKGTGTKFTFTKSSIVVDEPTPDPNEKRKPFYLPILEAFGMPNTADSPLIAAEQARGFTASFKPASTESGVNLPAQIVADPPFDLDYSESAKRKAGVRDLIYSRLSGQDEAIISEVNVNMNTAWNKTRKIDDPELKAFLVGNGFEYKGPKTLVITGIGIKQELFYNASKKVLCSVYAFPFGDKPQVMNFIKAGLESESTMVRAQRQALQWIQRR